jgi:uncharacterized glyoxalase superfamily protein PhnB
MVSNGEWGAQRLSTGGLGVSDELQHERHAQGQSAPNLAAHATCATHTTTTMASSSMPANMTVDGDPGAPPKVPEDGIQESLYYNKETATWRYETDDGAEMEFDAAKSAWVPVVRICSVLAVTGIF